MLASLFPWVLYLLAWVCALVDARHEISLATVLMYYVVIFNGGIQGLWAALGHLAFPDKTAQKIGWQSGGFQVEIGFTNLAIGITGLLTYLFPSWLIPIGLFMVIYYGGCAYNHIKDRIVSKNRSVCNSGPMLYSTIATVVTLLVCGLIIFL